MTLVYVLLAAHFVADFMCQTDWMAVNKSKRWDALAWHVLVYTCVVALGAAFTQPPSAYPYTTIGTFGLWVFVNAAAHFATDAVTSRITSRLWFFTMQPGIWAQADFASPKHDRTLVNPWTPDGGNRHWFFVVIGFDQLIHAVTLIATADWLLR